MMVDVLYTTWQTSLQAKSTHRSELHSGSLLYLVICNALFKFWIFFVPRTSLL